MKNRTYIPGGLGITGTREYEEAKKRKVEKREAISEYFQYLDQFKGNKIQSNYVERKQTD